MKYMDMTLYREKKKYIIVSSHQHKYKIGLNKPQFYCQIHSDKAPMSHTIILLSNSRKKDKF